MNHLRTLLLVIIFLPLYSIAGGMPFADNLQQTYLSQGKSPTGQSKVVLMLVSQPNCSYCVQITEEILQPMLISGNYESTTIFSELEINTGQLITDFSGQRIEATAFAQRYNAWATPTLLFLDSHGQQVAEKMVGINTLELYGYYVDRALKKGFAKINP